MANFTRITDAELRDKGVIGLPDTPELTSTAMQEKFDEIALDVLVPHFNMMAGELEDEFSTTTNKLVEESDRAKAAEKALSDALEAENERAVAAEEAEAQRALEAETALNEALTAESERAIAAEATLTNAISSENTRATAKEEELENAIIAERERAIAVEAQKGDMFIGVYDTDRDGIVDNAERLEGYRADHFAVYHELRDVDEKIGDLSDLTTTDKSSIVAAINEAAQTGGGGGGGEDSEAWAVGQRDGVDVPSDDPTYHNNSKYYSERSAESAQESAQSAQNAADRVTEVQTTVDEVKGIKAEISDMIGAVEFTIDFTTGRLIYTQEDTYTFSINQETGNLEWEVIAA